jgi:CheY-like chemotaxis protein
MANSYVAQVIHQGGVLVFANPAAARLFGFRTIAEFERFALSSGLFKHRPPDNSRPVSRAFPFRHTNGSRCHALICERPISWNGKMSVHLELKAIVPTHDNEMADALAQNDVVPVSSVHYQDMIWAAMDWSRLDGDTYEIIEEPLDFAHICVSICQDLSEYATDHDVALNVVITPRAQNIFQGDPLKLASVGRCLVRFAIDRIIEGRVASGRVAGDCLAEGRVDITLKADPNGDGIALEIWHNAEPYQTEEANSLFTLPEFAAPATQEGHQMMALQLPLARCIARSLGGDVKLKLSQSTGGLIKMHLPFKEFKPNTGNRTRLNVHQRRLTILVVDDDITSQYTLKIILESLGHRVSLTRDGHECLQITRQMQFDLILLDLNIPIINGYRMVESLRRREALEGISTPILAITADRRLQTTNKARDKGVTGFLVKPVHIPQIINALADCMELKATPNNQANEPSQ